MVNEELYNWEIKNEYLKQLSSGAAKVQSSHLRRLDKVEGAFQTDIYNADPLVLTAMLDDLLRLSLATNEQMYFTVKKYIDWAIANHISFQTENHARKYIIKAGYSQITDNFFFDFIELDRSIEALFRPDAAESVDICYKNYLELLYIGLTSNDIAELQKSHVDLDAQRIYYNDRVFEIPSSLAHRLRLDVSLPAYTVEQSTRTYQKEKASQIYLLSNHTYDRQELRNSTMYRLTVVKKEFKKNGGVVTQKFTLDNIFISGCMDRASRQPRGDDEEYLRAEYQRMKPVEAAALDGLIRNYRGWLSARL